MLKIFIKLYFFKHYKITIQNIRIYNDDTLLIYLLFSCMPAGTFFFFSSSSSSASPQYSPQPPIQSESFGLSSLNGPYDFFEIGVYSDSTHTSSDFFSFPKKNKTKTVPCIIINRECSYIVQSKVLWRYSLDWTTVLFVGVHFPSPSLLVPVTYPFRQGRVTFEYRRCPLTVRYNSHSFGVESVHLTERGLGSRWLIVSELGSRELKVGWRERCWSILNFVLLCPFQFVLRAGAASYFPRDNIQFWVFCLHILNPYIKFEMC